jgi:hypothetical protein
MKLIPDWRLAWRFMSVQAALLLALLSGIQSDVFPLAEPLFPPDKWPWISGTLALLVVVLRVIDQVSLDDARWQLEMDALEARMGTVQLDVELPLPGPAAVAPQGPSMPRGRLERYLGAALLLVIVMAVLSLVAVVLLALRGPST